MNRTWSMKRNSPTRYVRVYAARYVSSNRRRKGKTFTRVYILEVGPPILSEHQVEYVAINSASGPSRKIAYNRAVKKRIPIREEKIGRG